MWNRNQTTITQKRLSSRTKFYFSNVLFCLIYYFYLLSTVQVLTTYVYLFLWLYKERGQCFLFLAECQLSDYYYHFQISLPGLGWGLNLQPSKIKAGTLPLNFQGSERLFLMGYTDHPKQKSFDILIELIQFILHFTDVTFYFHINIKN